MDLTLSINPLDLMSSALRVPAIMDTGNDEESEKMVVRVENSSAYAFVNMCRALYKTIRLSLKILLNVQQLYMCRVFVQHLST